MNTYLIKKEIKENIFAMKGIYWMFTVALLLSALTLGFISIKELSLMAQNEILVTLGKVIFGMALLVVMILASISIAQEREQATFESLLLTPNPPIQIAFSKFIGVFLVWGMIYLVSLPYLYVMAHGTGMFLVAALTIAWVGSLVVALFTALSLAFSIWMKSSRSALVLSILALFITAAPMFLSSTAKAVGFAKIVNAMSPVTASTSLLKEIIINQSAFSVIWPYLATLLVGVVVTGGLFWLATKKLRFEGGDVL